MKAGALNHILPSPMTESWGKRWEGLRSDIIGYSISIGIDPTDAEDCAQDLALSGAHKSHLADSALVGYLFASVRHWKVARARAERIDRRKELELATDTLHYQRGGVKHQRPYSPFEGMEVRDAA